MNDYKIITLLNECYRIVVYLMLKDPFAPALLIVNFLKAIEPHIC